MRINNFALLCQRNFYNNNIYNIKGQIGVGGQMIGGNNSFQDSIIRLDNEMFLNAINELDSIYDYHLYNKENFLELNNLSDPIHNGKYFYNGDLTITENINFISNTYDSITIFISGNLTIEQDVMFILNEISFNKIRLIVDGNVMIRTNAWVLCTIIAKNNITINENVKGSFSLFSLNDIYLDNNMFIFSSNYINSINNNILPQLRCDTIGIVNNLLNNGSFSNYAICDTTANFLNGFKTDLYQRKLYNYCENVTSLPGYYKIDTSSENWNFGTMYVNDHTGDGGNLLFIDAFNTHRDPNHVPINFNNTTIWEQTISNLEGGKEYLFTFWATETNMIYNQFRLNIELKFNGVELPNTKIIIPSDTFQWRQYCIKYTPSWATGTYNNLTINLKQVNNFNMTGMDVVFDDFKFGLLNPEVISIDSTKYSDLCLGTYYILNVLNPQQNYTYQWKRNGVTIPNAIGTTYFANTSGVYTVSGYTNSGRILSSNTIVLNIISNNHPLEIERIVINSHEFWTNTSNPYNRNTFYIKDELIVKSGFVFDIHSLNFYFSANAKIIIEPGAIMRVNSNSLLTSYNCNGVMWNGVMLKSSSSPNSKSVFLISNSIIENARIGVTNYSSSGFPGIVETQLSTFRNNYISIQLKGDPKYFDPSTSIQNTKSNLSQFLYTDFISNNKLKDTINYKGGLHKYFIELNSINDVSISGCKFINTFNNDRPSSVNYINDEAKVGNNIGIFALNSNYNIRQQTNIFKNLYTAIEHTNSLPWIKTQIFQNIEFYSNAYGIIIRGGSSYFINYCKFNVDNNYPNLNNNYRNHIGVNLRGTYNTKIENCRFENMYCGILSNATNKKSNLKAGYNYFFGVGGHRLGIGQSIYLIGEHTDNSQIYCNDFYSHNIYGKPYSFIYIDGYLNDQGKIILQEIIPAGNLFIEIADTTLLSEIYISKKFSNFLYYAQNKLTTSFYAPSLRGQAVGLKDYSNTNVISKNNFSTIRDCPVFRPNSIELFSQIEDLYINNDSSYQNLIAEHVMELDIEDSTSESSIEFLNQLPYYYAKHFLSSYALNEAWYDVYQNTVLQFPIENQHNQDLVNYMFQHFQFSQDDKLISNLNEGDSTQISSYVVDGNFMNSEAKATLNALSNYKETILLPGANNELIYFDIKVNDDSIKLIFGPNPFKSKIKFLNLKDDLDYKLINILGYTIQDGKTISKEIDFSNIQDGLYYLLINQTSYPIIKQNEN